MAWTTLQTVMKIFLLLLHERNTSASPSTPPPPLPPSTPSAPSSTSSTSSCTSTSPRKPSGCLTENQLHERARKHLDLYEPWLRTKNRTHLSEQTCADAAKDARGDLSRRSLSPWTYRLDQDEDRVPPVVPMARCLCRGCILDGAESQAFNSVEVTAPLLVLRRRRCGDGGYTVKKEILMVVVGCVCVRPKYAG